MDVHLIWNFEKRHWLLTAFLIHNFLKNLSAYTANISLKSNEFPHSYYGWYHKKKQVKVMQNGSSIKICKNIYWTHKVFVFITTFFADFLISLIFTIAYESFFVVFTFFFLLLFSACFLYSFLIWHFYEWNLRKQLNDFGVNWNDTVVFFFV